MPGLTFREVANEFLKRRRIYTDDPRTLRSQVSVLNATFGDRKFLEIDALEIERWMAGRLDAGTSRATLNRNRAALSVIFEWAIKEGHHAGPNPIRAIKPFREGAGRTRYLTGDEAARLLLASAPHLKPIICIAIHTGARLSEILHLTWQDIDMEGGAITFRRETTKSSKTRHVPICKALAAVLAGQRRGRPDETVAYYDHRPLKSVRTAFEHAREQAGLGKDVTFHVLRHTFASWFIQNGGDLNRLQKYLGHSDISLTQRYAHMSREFLEDGARFIGPPAKMEARHKEEA